MPIDSLHHDIQDALAHLTRGDLVAAERGLRSALQSHPESVEILLPLARCAAGQGRLDEACALLERADALPTDDPRLRCETGAILRAAGRTDAAESAFRAALAIAPDLLPAMCNLGEILIAREEFPEALALLGRARRIAPDDPMVLGTLGAALTRAGHSDPAIDVLNRLVDQQPDSAPALATLAEALADQGRIGESEQFAREALVCEPRLAAAHFHVGRCRLDVGDLDGAVQSFRAAVNCEPALALPHAALGIALVALDNDDGADAAFASAEALDPRLAALRQSADCVRSAAASRPGQPPVNFAFTASHLRHALREAGSPGWIAEFGVYTGRSIRLLAGEVAAGEVVHGFDSFEGLPDDWTAGIGAGSYGAAGNLPTVPDNVELHVGLFADSLPKFLQTADGPVRFANIDCDIYSSARTVLEQCADRIVPGTVLVFDEYFAYHGWRDHEYRAFQEFLGATGYGYSYVALSPLTKQATVRVEHGQQA